MGQNVTLLPFYCSGQMAKTLRYCSTFKKDTVGFLCVVLLYPHGLIEHGCRNHRHEFSRKKLEAS
jgi:hypothetical protein